MWHDQMAMNDEIRAALSDKALKIAHVSDLHLPYEPKLTLRQRFSKRQLSAWSWRRRRITQPAAVLQALAEDLRREQPDHLVVTGDITNFSLPAEFQAAAQWFSSLERDMPVSMVPGNHDALVPLDFAQGIGSWSRWGGGLAWPYVHRRGCVSIIGLSSAVPTMPLLASGKLGTAQLEKLDQVLRAEGGAGQTRVVLLHHAVVDGALSWRKALRDRQALREVLNSAGAELVLHGHARSARLDAVAGPTGNIPVLCVASSTSLPNPRDDAARWHSMTFSAVKSPQWVQVMVRQWSVGQAAFETVANYQLALPSVK
jgi:3',5'-cyclic AMP phosphodiesterase CpdA